MLAKQHHNHSSPFPSPSCFRPSSAAAGVKAAPPVPAAPTLATSLYHTDLGLFALTWSKGILGRSFHLHFAIDEDEEASSTTSFHLHIKPLIFWKKQGSKKIQIGKLKNALIYWDLSRAKFGSGPEPRSGFYIAIVTGFKIALLVGDLQKEAYSKTKSQIPSAAPLMLLRREHVYGNKLYITKATVGNKDRNISIDCRVSGDDPRLCFYIDNKRVLQIKHLKWKFRGNERIIVDGSEIIISWDVHSWLFEEDDDGFALFMFKFEKQSLKQSSDFFFGNSKAVGFGFETRMMKKGSSLRPPARSSSSASSSLSSASSSCSSVMEWASTEENELKGPPGFSLLVYAWKS